MDLVFTAALVFATQILQEARACVFITCCYVKTHDFRHLPIQLDASIPPPGITLLAGSFTAIAGAGALAFAQRRCFSYSYGSGVDGDSAPNGKDFLEG